MPGFGASSLSSNVSQWIAKTLGVPADLQWRIMATVAVLLAFAAARRVATRWIARSVEDPAVRYGATKAVHYAEGIIVVLILANIWVRGITGLATYLGLLSAGLAIALQEPIVNLFGFGFILWRRPFEVGDRVEIGPHAGDVVDIRLFQFTLLEIGKWVNADQSTGRVVHVPNGWVFRTPVANDSRGLEYLWNEIPVTVTLESNWRRAKQVLTTILEQSSLRIDTKLSGNSETAKRYFIQYRTFTPIVWTSVSDDGVVLTMRYLCDPRKRRVTAAEIWEAILDQFAKLDDVDLAYKTHRVFHNTSEGKPHLGGPAKPHSPTRTPAPPTSKAGSD